VRSIQGLREWADNPVRRASGSRALGGGGGGGVELGGVGV